MKKNKLLATAFTAALFAVSSNTYAHEGKDMEKCQPVDKDGKSLIKPHKADCKTKTHGCKGQNATTDSEDWIMVKKGECENIKEGKKVSDETEEKLIKASEKKEGN